MEECFEDLSKEIFAVETGLSSDPPMNWRLSALDRINLVSNSDAHSTEKIAREANLFNTDLNYFKMREALKNKSSDEFLGTIEFFPEEGKYHYDGHRTCNLRWSPKEAIAHKLICPVCGKKITVGVLHRVELLADRNENEKPKLIKEFHSMIPLVEIIADAFGNGVVSKKVQAIYAQMLNKIGTELYILNDAPLEDIKKSSTEIIAEGIKRVREKKVTILPGYDGEYGKIIIFSEEDRLKNASQSLLITLNTEEKQFKNESSNLTVQKQAKKMNTTETIKITKSPPLDEKENKINPQQLEAIKPHIGPIIVIAGPGTGKTHTLINKIISLVNDHEYSASSILAITFTNKAAKELVDRLRQNNIENVKTSTFHSLALEILKNNHFNREIFDEFDSFRLLKETFKELNVKRNLNETFTAILKAKANEEDTKNDDELKNISELYQAKLDYYKGMDFEDIIIYCYKLLKRYPEILNKIKKQYQYILVDEFQDVNYYEFNLIKLLSDYGKNLFVIGDPDQCIYKFRGSSPDFIYQLREEYSLAKIVRLKNNYRNPESVVNASI